MGRHTQKGQDQPLAKESICDGHRALSGYIASITNGLL